MTVFGNPGPGKLSNLLRSELLHEVTAGGACAPKGYALKEETRQNSTQTCGHPWPPRAPGGTAPLSPSGRSLANRSTKRPRGIHRRVPAHKVTGHAENKRLEARGHLCERGGEWEVGDERERGRVKESGRERYRDADPGSRSKSRDQERGSPPGPPPRSSCRASSTSSAPTTWRTCHPRPRLPGK